MPEYDSLLDALHRYETRYPAEQERVSRFRGLLCDGSLAYRRERLAGHLTASAWVLDPEWRRVLLVHHRKLDKWLQPGGHADGHTDLLGVARREVLEETGIETEPLAGGEILDMDIHPIPPHGGVPAHEHFDIRFLLVAAESREPEANEESHDVAWVALDEVEGLSTEESLLRMRRKARAILRRS
jgi:8-oxo-dGTP pyrophosphatase MutT (NUDIX family)